MKINELTIADCRFGLPVADWSADCRLECLAIEVTNGQSAIRESTVDNANLQSPIGNP
jgi:hypothetical protein